MDAVKKKAIDEILTSHDLTFGDLSFIYTFTNENIRKYLSLFNLENKDILTVTGSGDHVLNMLLSVDKIDTFDINLFAHYFFILKKYAVAALELDEYLDFFSMDTSDFDIKKFRKIKQIWQDEKDALYFFEYIFHSKNSSNLKNTSLFVSNKKEGKEENIERNLYLDEENYYKLKRNILDKQITFHHSNIKSLRLEEKFDYIFMSNITDYLFNMFEGDILRNYKKFLYSNLIPMLKENGKIISYLYNGRMQNFSREEMNMVLNYGFTEKSIGKDKILLYERKFN